MNNIKVVAVSGVSGSGKTTLVKQLANEFNCPFLLFDDHTDESTYPQDMKYWLKNGANTSLIKTPTFFSSLEKLILKNSSRFIFIEEPFGKERDVMCPLIDYVVFIRSTFGVMPSPYYQKAYSTFSLEYKFRVLLKPSMLYLQLLR